MINLGGDEKLVVDAAVRPTPPLNDSKIIDATAQELEPIPPKRGPGRPPGSKNKPKLPMLPGFAVTEDDSSGQPL